MDKVEAHPNTMVMVGFVRRFDENYRAALTKIRNGVIGSPIIVRSQGAEKLDKSGYFIEYARHSGGIFVDSVVHDIDLTLSFLGEDVQPKSLWATGLITHHHEMKDFQDADNAVGVVSFWDGRIAHYYHSRTTAHGYDNCTEIIGTEGKISINLVPNHNRLQVSNTAGIQQDATPSWIHRYEDAFVTELEQFTYAIREKKELPLKLSSAYTGLKIALALQESLVTGKKIDFDEHGERIE
jgi:myo-inositol 2-dehydrogenase/D-chiro-inositol 1-dehydrogenase